ncbi:hypothetical protein DENSPDRAFT_885876 [Dentipellis sp. KUC8613]|nr:hypothetical protein DENSPDRAFT_885876 [Dentipellis sp. KUC8613]
MSIRPTPDARFPTPPSSSYRQRYGDIVGGIPPMLANAMALPNASLLAVYDTAIGDGAFSRPPCSPPVGPLTDASLISHRAERALGRVPSLVVGGAYSPCIPVLAPPRPRRAERAAQLDDEPLSARYGMHPTRQSRRFANELTGDGMFGPIAGRILHPLCSSARGTAREGLELRDMTTRAAAHGLLARLHHRHPACLMSPWATDVRPER